MKHLPLKFDKSAANYQDLPKDQGSEVIFAGYSNVGKSSLINALANNKGLAKFSRTPGRTRLFNIFSTNEDHRILDLPGYGFAKVSAKSQRIWENRLNEYLEKRHCLKGIVIITDIRRGLREFDTDLLEYCINHSVPVCLILNKADKLSKQEARKAQQMLINTFNIPDTHILLCSCLKKTGLESILDIIRKWFSEK